MFVSKVSHLVSSHVNTSLFCPPPPQLNCRTGKALKHTEVLLWYLVIKSPTQQLVSWFCNRSNKQFRSQTKFQSQNEFWCKICIFRCKNHLSIQGKNSNSCKKLSRNQNTFQFMSASQKSPAMSGANASIRSFLQSSL